MPYAFGPFILDVGEYRLTRDGNRVPLSPRPFDLLTALVERAPRLVSREELLGLVWHDAVVEQSSLNAAMSVLRQALGAHAGELIETVPGRGYRFLGDVRTPAGAGTSGDAVSSENPVVAGAPAAAACRVLVVDDHAIVRIGVRTILERVPGCEVVGEAGSIGECGTRMAELRPDLVVLDLMLGSESTLPHIPRWRAVAPDVRIIVLSMHEEDEQARLALASGAQGYVMKSQMLDELTEAITTVSVGGVWVSARLGRALVHEFLQRGSLSG